MAGGAAPGDDPRGRGARVRRDQAGVPARARGRGGALRRAAGSRGARQGDGERLSARPRRRPSGLDGRGRTHLDLVYTGDRERGARGRESHAGGVRARGCERASAPDGHPVAPWAASPAAAARGRRDRGGRNRGDVLPALRERERFAACGAGLRSARAAVQAHGVQFRLHGARGGYRRPDVGYLGRRAPSGRVMTLQRKLLLGFALMVLPTLFVGVQAIRTNALERATLETLGQRLARSRTYADVEDAMFNQTQVIWRYLGGDPTAKQEFPLTVQVVDFRFDRWTADLPPDEIKLADAVRRIEADIQAVAARVFQLHDAGQRDQAALIARRELLERLQPTLASVNREIYRQARELSVQGAVAQMRGIVEAKRRLLWATVFVALVAGLLASWLISRDLARPLTELRHAMAVVGAGDLEHSIVPRSSDEIGDLARAFARMTEQLRQSRAELVQSEKLASIGQMAAAVAHGLRNPLASLRAAAQLARHRVDAPAPPEQLDAIVEQVDRLDLRIAHLLQFSRPAPFRPLRERVQALGAGAGAGRRRPRRCRRRVPDLGPRYPPGVPPHPVGAVLHDAARGNGPGARD